MDIENLTDEQKRQLWGDVLKSASDDSGEYESYFGRVKKDPEQKPNSDPHTEAALKKMKENPNAKLTHSANTAGKYD